MSLMSAVLEGLYLGKEEEIERVNRKLRRAKGGKEVASSYFQINISSTPSELCTNHLRVCLEK